MLLVYSLAGSNALSMIMNRSSSGSPRRRAISSSSFFQERLLLSVDGNSTLEMTIYEASGCSRGMRVSFRKVSGELRVIKAGSGGFMIVFVVL